MRTPATLVLCLSASLSGQEVQAPEALLEVRESILQSLEAGEFVGMSIAAVRDGEVIWAEGFGFADREGKIPATSDTVYRLGTLGQILTATVLMRMADAGDIDLQAPIQGLDEVRIRDVASYDAGLPAFYSYPRGGAVLPMDEAIRRYGFASPFYAAPEQRELSYGILAHICSRVAGKPWSSVLEEQLLDVLSMDRTGVGHPKGDGAATHYERGLLWKFERLEDYRSAMAGSTGMSSSVRDLVRLALLYLQRGSADGRELLTAETVSSMTSTRAPRIGWQYRPLAVVPCFEVQRPGATPGVWGRMLLQPEERIAVIQLGNSRTRSTLRDIDEPEFAWDVLDTLSDYEPPGPVFSLGLGGGLPDRPALGGDWSGSLDHFDSPIPFGLRIADDHREAWLEWGDRTVQLIRFRTSLDQVHLAFRADIRTQEGHDGPTNLEMSLRGIEGKLSGICYAEVSGFFKLPFRVELERR